MRRAILDEHAREAVFRHHLQIRLVFPVGLLNSVRICSALAHHALS